MPLSGTDSVRLFLNSPLGQPVAPLPKVAVVQVMVMATGRNIDTSLDLSDDKNVRCDVCHACLCYTFCVTPFERVGKVFFTSLVGTP